MFLKHLNPLNNIRVAQGVEIKNYNQVIRGFQELRQAIELEMDRIYIKEEYIDS